MATAWKEFVNNAGSELTAMLTNTATSFSVPDGEGGFFPSSGPFWVTVFGTTVAEGHEIILVGSISGDTMSGCTRGQQGTSAAQWPAGSNVQLLWTAGGVEQIQDAITALEEGTTLTDLSFTQDVQVRKAGASVTPKVTFLHSRGSISSPTATQSTDSVGSVLWQAFSATLTEVALGEIVVLPDGQIPAAGDSPGMMEFRVTPNASATPSVALTLYNDKSATAGASEIQIWDAAGYVPTSAIKTGTSNNAKVLASGATEGSAAFTALATLLGVTGNAGKHLYTDGSTLSWTLVIPDQTSHAGEYLTTNGTTVSWSAVAGGSPGTDSVGADELIENEAITLLSLTLSGVATGSTTPLVLRTARGTLGSPTNNAANDGIILQFSHYLNSGYQNTASIKVAVDGTAGSGDYPTRMEFRVTKDGTAAEFTNANMVIKNSGIVGIGEPTPDAAHLTIYNSNSSFNFPVLKLQQADQDEPFIEFTGTSAADTTKNISTAAIGTYTGKIRCSINGTDYWIPYYAAA